MEKHLTHGYLLKEVCAHERIDTGTCADEVSKGDNRI